jgi:dTDP-4-amino-4,6-dideoxygalactose transaminase
MDLPEWPVSTGRELELLRQVMESGQWGGYHEFVKRFESEFAAFVHCAHGVSAMNGTVTLEMALAAAGVGPGDEVIVPAISFISTATAVSRVGAVPVFVDIEPLSFNIDPERAAAAMTPRTRAVIVVHFGGAMADLDRLLPLAAEHGLALIEDAAHAHGSEWRGRRAGSLGLASSFSFQNSKVMTAGEGGILTTNDAAFAGRAWSLMDQGRRPGGGWFSHYVLASNYRMTGLQAAVLLAQLERLPEQVCRRTRNAALLRAELADVPGLALQAVPVQQNANSWYLLLGRVAARDEFHCKLTAQDVPCTPFYPHPLYGNPLYRQGGCRVAPCPVAEACVRDAFWLPHRVLLGDEETTRELAAAVRQACGE